MTLVSYNSMDASECDNVEKTLAIHSQGLVQAHCEDWQLLWGTAD